MEWPARIVFEGIHYTFIEEGHVVGRYVDAIGRVNYFIHWHALRLGVDDGTAVAEGL